MQDIDLDIIRLTAINSDQFDRPLMKIFLSNPETAIIVDEMLSGEFVLPDLAFLGFINQKEAFYYSIEQAKQSAAVHFIFKPEYQDKALIDYLANEIQRFIFNVLRKPKIILAIPKNNRKARFSAAHRGFTLIGRNGDILIYKLHFTVWEQRNRKHIP